MHNIYQTENIIGPIMARFILSAFGRYERDKRVDTEILCYLCWLKKIPTKHVRYCISQCFEICLEL